MSVRKITYSVGLFGVAPVLVGDTAISVILDSEDSLSKKVGWGTFRIIDIRFYAPRINAKNDIVYLNGNVYTTDGENVVGGVQNNIYFGASGSYFGIGSTISVGSDNNITDALQAECVLTFNTPAIAPVANYGVYGLVVLEKV